MAGEGQCLVQGMEFEMKAALNGGFPWTIWACGQMYELGSQVRSQQETEWVLGAREWTEGS